MQRIILENTIGSAIQNIASVKVLKQIKIPIPPLEIQRRIVKRLDEAFARIDSGTKHLKSAKDNLTKYKQSLLKSAFNGTLTNDSSLSQGESMSLQGESTTKQSINTHPLAPSAREGEREDSPHTREGEQVVCHDLKSPLPCGGDLGVVSTRTRNVIDCHESANADSRNDENSPSFVGGQGIKNSPSLARGGGDSESSPSLAEGARGWVNPRNDDNDLLNGKSANLPQGWTIKTLGEIAHTTSGRTPSRKVFDYWNGNIKWLKSGELNDDYINEVEESITQIGLDKSSAKIFPKGTLLIALYGATIGKLGILNIETATNQAICAITPNNKLDTKYLFHFLFSIRDKMIQDAFGGAQSNISQTYLKQLKIPIPPLEIQRQIVAILEKHFTSADKVSAYIDSCLSKAKQLKSSLLKSAFAGELV